MKVYNKLEYHIHVWTTCDSDMLYFWISHSKSIESINNCHCCNADTHTHTYIYSVQLKYGSILFIVFKESTCFIACCIEYAAFEFDRLLPQCQSFISSDIYLLFLGIL